VRRKAKWKEANRKKKIQKLANKNNTQGGKKGSHTIHKQQPGILES
jgi:hypothetical protein